MRRTAVECCVRDQAASCSALNINPVAHSYFAYGIGIHSDLVLPELVAARSAAPDLVIRLETINWSPAELDKCVVRVGAEEIHFSWPGVGKFLARGGREIVVEPAGEAQEYVLRLFLLGAVLAGVLHQRGLLLLHASAVAIDGEAIAFIGEKGWGKSTIAASLKARQHELLADDILAIDIGSSNAVQVLPGFPQFKLWPDAITSLGVNPEELPLLHPQLEKRAYRLAGNFSTRPFPLKSIYVLAVGARSEIVPIGPQEAFIELVRHSYLARYLEPTGAARSHFYQCGLVAGSVSAFRLKRPRSLRLLSDMAILIEESLGKSPLLDPECDACKSSLIQTCAAHSG